MTKRSGMNKLDGLMAEGAKSVVASGSASAEARPQPVRPAGQDHVDAVNQMFAEFELAYHNQYHKAYPDAGSVNIAKKYWLSCLRDFAPELLLKAVRKVVSSQPYLPSVAAIVEACEDSMGLYGLPSPREAYIEACRAPAPKTAFAWSHPAVYLAGRACGWFELANQPEAAVYPLFEYHYRLLADRALRGEDLLAPAPAALPENSAVPLDKDENLARLASLRKNLGL